MAGLFTRASHESTRTYSYIKGTRKVKERDTETGRQASFRAGINRQAESETEIKRGNQRERESFKVQQKHAPSFHAS